MSNWLASVLMTADNKKVLAYNVFNTETGQLKPIPADKFIEVLKTNKDAVENARIDSNGELETDGALERYNKFTAEATNSIKAANKNQVMNYIVLGYAKDTRLKTFLLLNPYTGQLDTTIESVIERLICSKRCGLANAKLSNGTIVGLGKPLKMFSIADYRYNNYTKNDEKIQVLKEEVSTTLVSYYGNRNQLVNNFNYLITTHMNVTTDIDMLTIDEKDIKTDKFASGISLNEISALRVDLRNKTKNVLNIKKLMIDLRRLTDNDRYAFARNIFIECNTECNIGEVEIAYGQLRISSLNFGANINDIDKLVASEISAKADYSTGYSLYVTRTSIDINTNVIPCEINRISKIRTDKQDLTFRRVEFGASKITRVIFDDNVYFKEIYDTRKKNSEVLNVYGLGLKGYKINNLGKQNIHFELNRPIIHTADTLNKLNIALDSCIISEVKIDKANIELDELDVAISWDGVSQLNLVSNQQIKSIHIKKLVLTAKANGASQNVLGLILFKLSEPTDVYIDDLRIEIPNIDKLKIQMPNSIVHTKTNSNIIAICEKFGIKYIIDDLKKSDEMYSYKAKILGNSILDILANDVSENYKKALDKHFEKVSYTLTGKEKVLTDRLATCFKINRISDKTDNTNVTTSTVVSVDKAFKNIVETLKSLFGNITSAIEGNYVLDNLAYTYLNFDKSMRSGYCTSLKVIEDYEFGNASIQILGTDNNKLGLEMHMCYIIAEVERKIVYFNYIPKTAQYSGNAITTRRQDNEICLHGVMNKDILNILVTNSAILYTKNGISISIGNMEQKLDIDVMQSNFLGSSMMSINNFFAGMFTMHIVDIKKHRAVYLAIDAEGTAIQLDMKLERIKEYGRAYDNITSAKFVPVDVTELKEFMCNHTKNSLLLKVFRQCPNEKLDKIEKQKNEATNKINIQEILNCESKEEAIIKFLDTNVCYDNSKVEMFSYETETVNVTDNIYKIQADLYNKDNLAYYEFDYCYNKKSHFTLCNLEEAVIQIRINTKKDAKLLSLNMNNIYCFNTAEIYNISNYFIDLCVGDTIKNFIVNNCNKRVPITSLNLIADADGKICLAALYYAKAKLYLIPVLELMNVGALVKNAKANIIDDIKAVTDYRYCNKQLQKSVENYIKYLMNEKRCKLISNTPELTIYEANTKDIDIKSISDVTIRGILALKGNQDKLEKQTILLDLDLSYATVLSVIHMANCDIDSIYLR